MVLHMYSIYTVKECSSTHIKSFTSQTTAEAYIDAALMLILILAERVPDCQWKGKLWKIQQVTVVTHARSKDNRCVLHILKNHLHACLESIVITT